MTKTRILSMAVAAGLASLVVAGQAAATGEPEIKLVSDSMDTKYTADIKLGGKTVDAYTNGVTFNVYDWNPALNGGHGGTTGSEFKLFGFCVDITHEIGLGNLNLLYNDNEDPKITDPLPTDFDGDTITSGQLGKLTNLIDTGYDLHGSEYTGTLNSSETAYNNNIELQLAAIQAAIWAVENPDATITLNNGSAKAGNTSDGGAITGAGLTYQQYYNDYVSGQYTSLADANDKFYTITPIPPENASSHQTFAIGWPIPGVPEPATWAMMLMGFGGLGAMLRARRRRAALA